MADLPNISCDIGDNFYDHKIIFDITYVTVNESKMTIRFCGDWAGSVYSNSGCPDTCAEFVENNPEEFWSSFFGVRSLKVYRASTPL